MTMRDAPDLHLWHTNMDVGVMVDGVNHMIGEINTGKQVFYDIYTKEEKENDPTKENTGLFFFRGEPGQPFAVVSAGGGFAYVGSLHEGFPLAMEINKSGYNAFVLKYRVGQGETVSSQDLKAAVEFVLEHAGELEVSSDNYSLWGGSAGARISSNVSYGEGGIERLIYCIRQRLSWHIPHIRAIRHLRRMIPQAFSWLGQRTGLCRWNT